MWVVNIEDFIRSEADKGENLNNSIQLQLKGRKKYVSSLL